MDCVIANATSLFATAVSVKMVTITYRIPMLMAVNVSKVCPLFYTASRKATTSISSVL